MSWRTGVNTVYGKPATLSRRCPVCKKWRRSWSIAAMVRHLLELHTVKESQ